MKKSRFEIIFDELNDIFRNKGLFPSKVPELKEWYKKYMDELKEALELRESQISGARSP